MNEACMSDETEAPGLLLFVAGDSPRSRRARERLVAALEARGLDAGAVELIDTLREPAAALRHRIFATPALTANPPTDAVLYGDLADDEPLQRFLAGLA